LGQFVSFEGNKVLKIRTCTIKYFTEVINDVQSV
jgi:hypothetical protein